MSIGELLILAVSRRILYTERFLKVLIGFEKKTGTFRMLCADDRFVLLGHIITQKLFISYLIIQMTNDVSLTDPNNKLNANRL